MADLPLPEALARAGEHLISFGGHAAAAGLEIRSRDVEAFRARFGEVLSAYPASGDSSFDTLSLKRVDQYVIEGTSKKDGQVAVTFRWEVSKDGKTLTRTQKRFRPPEQAGTSVEIFQKQ